MSDDLVWELAIAVNAAFKGLVASTGESGHICAEVFPVKVELACVSPSSLYREIAEAVLASSTIQDGDVVVVAEKVFPVAEGRVGPRELLTSPDPKKVDGAKRLEIAETVSAAVGFPVSELQLLLADELTGRNGERLATLGAADHNRSARDVALEIAKISGFTVDVVIADTDTGLDVRRPLIGTITIGATPVGATAGLNLYEAMRCACAAEFARGHRRRIPIVVCRPAERCQSRPRMSEFRYDGAIDSAREPGGLTYA